MKNIRHAFRDSVLQEEFSNNGYVVVNLAEPGELKNLAEAYQYLYPNKEQGCVFSCHDTDFVRKLKAQNLLRHVIGEKALNLFDAYKFVSGAFVAKHPGETSVVSPHTDLTFVDNKQYSAVAVWTPLTELTSEAGRLHILAGSHHYTPLCGSNLYSKYTDIAISSMTEIDLEIGQAVCYDMRTIHASPANKSLSPRLAGNCVFIPDEADLWHITRQDGKILIYSVDNDFYSRQCGDEASNQELLRNYRVIHSEPFESDLLVESSQWNNSQPFGFFQRVIKRLGIV